MGKKSFILGIVTILIVIVFISIHFVIPKKIIQVDGDIDKITIFKGNTGELITITDENEINNVIDVFSEVEFLEKGFTLWSLGYGLDIVYYDDSGKKLKRFIVNSEDTIKYRGFFYQPQNGVINYEYLSNLTSK